MALKVAKKRELGNKTVHQQKSIHQQQATKYQQQRHFPASFNLLIESGNRLIHVFMAAAG